MINTKVYKPIGMIIIGYFGIGKTCTASSRNDIIDLEIFSMDDKEWYDNYVKQAVHLAKQGYTVCISSHGAVRKQLQEVYTWEPNHVYNIVSITPTLFLHNKWVERLRHRYKENPCMKNKIALDRCIQHFYDDIESINKDPYFSHILLNTMDYDLESIISNLRAIYRDYNKLNEPCMNFFS